MINQVIIEGRLGKDPVVHTFGERSIFKFTLAFRENWKDRKSGEWKEKTSWFNVDAVGASSWIVENLKKGDLVVCTGKVVVDNWENPETKVKSNFVKLVANTVQKIEIIKRSVPVDSNPGSPDSGSDDLPF